MVKTCMVGIALMFVPHYEYCFDKTGIPDGLAATYMCAGLTAFSAMKKSVHHPTAQKMFLCLDLVASVCKVSKWQKHFLAVHHLQLT